MANAYSAPNFNIDTDIDEAGLATLKGSAVATTDVIFVYNGAKVTLGIAGNFACDGMYLGDNSAGTAVTKTGYCDILNKGGFTVTFHSATLHNGLSGEGSTSKYIITGAAGNRVILKGNTAAKSSDSNVQLCANEYQHVEFQQFAGLYLNNAATVVNDVLMNGLNSGSGSGFAVYTMPGTYTSNATSNIGAAGFPIYEGARLSNADLTEISRQTSHTGATAVVKTFGLMRVIGTEHIQIKRNAASFLDAPAWTTTTGIQSLADNVVSASGSLVASWGAATSARGEQVRYHVYIRNGSAPDSFGMSSVYFWGAVTGTSAIIASEADGTALIYGDTYHVIVHCADVENEDTNTTVLTAIPTNLLDTVNSKLSTVNQRLMNLPQFIIAAR
jgi:hypothetical protein